MRMGDDDEDDDAPEVEFVPDDLFVVEGEVRLFPSVEAVCERFGLLGLNLRDGFLYAFTTDDGEILFSDFLKKRPREGAPVLTAIGSKRRQ